MKVTDISILEKWTALVISGMFAFMTPLVPMFGFVGFLVMFDWITGIIKGKKSDEGVQSDKLIRKFWVSAGYFIAILVGRGVELYIGDNIVVKPIVAIIAVTELQSLRENIKSITGLDLLKLPVKIMEKKGK